MLKGATYYLPEECLKTLYLSILEPSLRYCCSVLETCSVTEESHPQYFQVGAARIVTNSRFDASSRPLIEILVLKSIDKFIAEESKTILYKSLYGLTPQYFCHLVTRNVFFHIFLKVVIYSSCFGLLLSVMLSYFYLKKVS